MLLFASQDYVNLQTPDGKEMLKKVTKEALQKILQREIGNRGIESVLFTNFVMQ